MAPRSSPPRPAAALPGPGAAGPDSAGTRSSPGTRGSPGTPNRPGAPAGNPPPRLSRQLAGLGFDIGAPIAAYYLLHVLGASNLVALGAGAVLPAISAAWTLALKRRSNTVALVVLATMVTSITISVLARDPRFLLARDGLITGLWGIWFLASTRARRPAAFQFARPLLEGRKIYTATDWDALWQAEPAFRRIWRTSTLIWGAGMLADAAARVVISYTLPVTVVPGLGGALWPVTFVILQIITNVYCHLAGLNQILGARWLSRPRRPAPDGQ